MNMDDAISKAREKFDSEAAAKAAIEAAIKRGLLSQDMFDFMEEMSRKTEAVMKQLAELGLSFVAASKENKDDIKFQKVIAVGARLVFDELQKNLAGFATVHDACVTRVEKLKEQATEEDTSDTQEEPELAVAADRGWDFLK